MNYQYSFTIQPRTPITTPVSSELKPLQGLLLSGSVVFPPGCKNQVGLKILANGYSQIVPSNSGWLTGDGNQFDFSFNNVLEGPPYLITLQGYNHAIDWEHTIRVMFRLER